MLAVRTPGAPQTARVGAAFGSAFPFCGTGSATPITIDFGAIFPFTLFRPTTSLSTLRSGAVTGHHARLGSRLLARLYRGRHLRRQSSTHFARRNSHTTVRTGPYTAVR